MLKGLNHEKKPNANDEQDNLAQSAKIWKVTRKTAANRLKQLCEEGLLVEISKGPFDPYKVFILAKPGNQVERT